MTNGHCSLAEGVGVEVDFELADTVGSGVALPEAVGNSEVEGVEVGIEMTAGVEVGTVTFLLETKVPTK